MKATIRKILLSYRKSMSTGYRSTRTSKVDRFQNPALDGTVIDDWMKARMLVSKDAKVTVVILEPCRHRELTAAGIAALKKWTFDPQMQGDVPVDGELTIRIHFHTK